MREDGYFGRYPRYTFFLISTPFFSPSLDVLIFWAFSASNVLKGVLNLISNKILESCFKNLVKVREYSTTVKEIITIIKNDC